MKTNLLNVNNRFIFILFAIPLFVIILNNSSLAQSKKQVHITLDVSGSMSGDKYNLANYTTQMISTLCNKNDEIFLYIYGKQSRIANPGGVDSRFLIPYLNLNTLPNNKSINSQMDDIIAFNREFKADTDYEQWLFIIGDGIWSTEAFKSDTQKFTEFATNGHLKVCFLQTGHQLSENNDFTEYLDNLKVIHILKSSTDPATIIESCNNFTSIILGLSYTPLVLRKLSDACAEVKLTMPVKKFFVIYQDEVLERDLPTLITVSQSLIKPVITHKGTPSTSKIRGNNEKLLSGGVWEVNSPNVLNTNQPVSFCFDKKINLKKLKIFPVVDVKVSVGQIEISTGGVEQIDENTVAVCKDNKEFRVTYSLVDPSGNKLPENILKDTKVEVISGKKTYKANYINGNFVADIPLKDDTTFYLIKSELPGYFSRTSAGKKVIRTDDCAPSQLPDITMPAQTLGRVRFNDLMRGDCVKGTIYDTETLEVLDPEKFDIEVTHNYPLLFKKVTIRIEGNTLYLCFTPRGDWCDCFFPDVLEVTARISPKPGADFGGKQYPPRVIPLRVPVDKEDWLSRCLWVLIAIGIALLLLIYFYFLSRKKRFKRGSKINDKYSDYYNDNYPPHKFTLRKKGFTHWLNRWFNPFVNEKHAINFTMVNKILHFQASTSKYYIEFPKSEFNKSVMNYPDYDPENNEHFIRFSEGNVLTIQKSTADEGKLKVDYDPRNSITDDVPLFRIFVAVIMFGLFTFIGFALYLLLQTL